MKRGTPNHRKMHALAEALKLPLYGAVGIMEMLWHFAGQQTPEGDLGRVPDRQIAAAVDWNKKPEALVTALVAVGWLDRNEKYRLIIHDWAEHVEYEVARKLLREKKDFIEVYGMSAKERGKPSEVPRSFRESSGNLPGICAPHAKASGLGSELSNSEKEKNQKVSEIWRSAGFEGADHFDVWWTQVVENHPNRTKNTYAKSELFELIVSGQFSREEFEAGYAQLRESKADDWTKENGKYCTNLYEIIHNRLWKFKAEVEDDWIAELSREQALERGQRA